MTMGVALLGCTPKPLSCLRVVPRHAVTVEIHNPESPLSERLALFGSAPKPMSRPRVVPRHAAVFGPEQRLSFGIPLLGGGENMIGLPSALRHSALSDPPWRF